jgi:hypothetical protein
LRLAAVLNEAFAQVQHQLQQGQEAILAVLSGMPELDGPRRPGSGDARLKS